MSLALARTSLETRKFLPGLRKNPTKLGHRLSPSLTQEASAQRAEAWSRDPRPDSIHDLQLCDGATTVQWRATTPSEVSECLRRATAEGTRLVPRGQGSRALANLPPGIRTDAAFLQLDGMAGIDHLDPQEMVLTAQAGTPLAEIEAALVPHGLFLPPLLLADLRGSLGGLFSDPRNTAVTPRLGRVRDHVLGVEAVRGDGTSFRAGGRVVKNVTGYDLTRFLCGARGRWAVVTRLHWRLLPRPERIRAAHWQAEDTESLWRGLDALRDSPCDPLRASVYEGPSPELEIVECGSRLTCDARLDRSRALLREAGLVEKSMTEAPCDAAIATDDSWPVRINLPYGAWRGFHRCRELTWSGLHPFAHYGVTRLAGPTDVRLQTVLELRDEIAALGGSAQLDHWPDSPPPELASWNRRAEPAALARVEQSLAQAWDPAGVLHHEETEAQ